MSKNQWFIRIYIFNFFFNFIRYLKNLKSSRKIVFFFPPEFHCLRFIIPPQSRKTSAMQWYEIKCFLCTRYNGWKVFIRVFFPQHFLLVHCGFPQINAPPPPRSPPPTSSRSSSSRGGGASNASTCPLTRSDDTLCQLPPEIPREHLTVVQTLTKTHFGEVSNEIALYR